MTRPAHRALARGELVGRVGSAPAPQHVPRQDRRFRLGPGAADRGRTPPAHTPLSVSARSISTSTIDHQVGPILLGDGEEGVTVAHGCLRAPARWGRRSSAVPEGFSRLPSASAAGIAFIKRNGYPLLSRCSHSRRILGSLDRGAGDPLRQSKASGANRRHGDGVVHLFPARARQLTPQAVEEEPVAAFQSTGGLNRTFRTGGRSRAGRVS